MRSSARLPVSVFILFLVCVVLTVPSETFAEDWPEWRGKGRLGVWNETGILEQFPTSGLEFTWRVPIGEGYGGPSVADGRVFVTEFERRGRGTQGIERVLCLDEATGARLWSHEWPIDTKGLMFTYANGPRATPTVDGDRVYVLGSYGNLFCLRVADGGVVWSLDFVKDFESNIPTWGTTGAPLVDGERLFCFVGGEPDAMVMAFDKMTGSELWRSLPADSEIGYAPPVIIDAGGTRQLIMWHPTAISSLDPLTGKVFWEKPYKVDMGQTIATPVQRGNRLLVSSASHGTTMLTLDPAKPAAAIAWKGKSVVKAQPDGIHAFISTPFLDGDYIYGIGGMGRLRCVEAKSGKELWATTQPNEDARIATAFLVKNGDRFFINNDRGELIIARLSPEGYTEISRTKLIEPTNKNTQTRRKLNVVNWCHPAYANGHIIQRNDREIVRASLAKP